MSKETFSKAYRAKEQILYLTAHLYETGEAAYILGNDLLGKNLCNLADSIEEAANKLMDAYSEQLSERTQDAQQSSRNVLSAVLAGLQLGEK